VKLRGEKGLTKHYRKLKGARKGSPLGKQQEGIRKKRMSASLFCKKFSNRRMVGKNCEPVKRGKWRKEVGLEKQGGKGTEFGEAKVNQQLL